MICGAKACKATFHPIASPKSVENGFIITTGINTFKRQEIIPFLL
jgi:hypothetical protein